MNQPSLSLCCIMKNEAGNIDRLLDSVDGCFDEIILTDTGSTDGTIEIAQKRGVTLQHFDWVNDFAAARNASIANVKTDYWMWLDLDDVLENKEVFLKFKKSVMKIADYWVAPYHYASDADGNSVCTFIRERVIKTSRNLKWAYFVHEGVKAEPGIQVSGAQGWAVRHMRTQDDIVKDRSRNLKIFEDQLKHGPLDARMRYYYGKELYENEDVAGGITALESAVTDPSLELHDRILGMQYLVAAYLRTENHQKAISLANTAILLDPNRAEFHVMLADAYVRAGQLLPASIFYTAAKACQRPTSSMSPIFHVANSYEEYPRNQLCKVYANLGNLEAARKEAIECIEKYKNPEARALLMEVDRVSTAMRSYKFAQPCEDIVFTTPPQTAYSFDPGIAQTKAMGGSETALMEMAKWLKQLTGRKVIVFNMRDGDQTFEGVEYRSNQALNAYMAEHKPYAHIAWRHNMKLTDATTFLYCHDLFTAGAENTANYQKLLCLTPFHKDFSQVNQGIPAEKIQLTRNGVISERFTEDGSIPRDPWKFIFSSSPDRGLDRTMRVLDIVRKTYPEIKLHIYYGIEHLEKWGHAELQKTLKAMMEERKDWVIYHGATQQDELMREFKSAAYCLQPSDFIETSMISAIERLCCGVFQIIRSVGGAVDTLAQANLDNMACLVDSNCQTEDEYSLYALATIEAIKEEAYKRVKVDASQFDWKIVAQEWIRDILPVQPELREYGT